MTNINQISIVVMRRTTIAILRRPKRPGSRASALHGGAEGLQQFVIEQKHDSRASGVTLKNVAVECGNDLVGEFSPRVDFFLTRSS